jgi:preprotein translocase subunit YajC
VCTTSGLFGRVTALDATSASLEISPGVVVRYDRRAIGMKVTSPQAPATGAGAGE